MNKLIITIFAIFVLLALIGASCQSPFGKKTKEFTSIADYRKGKEGLKVKPLETMPKEIPEYNKFRFGFDLVNMGPSDIKDSYVKVKTDDYLNVLEETDDFIQINKKEAISKQFTFSARSPLNPTGSETFAFLNLQADRTLDRESVNSELKITACYDYSTYVIKDVCVDSKQYLPEIRPTACKVQEIKLSGGQGGPIAVTNIRPYFLYENENNVKPYFEISIANIEKGDAFYTLGKCLEDFPGSRCNDVRGTLCGEAAPGGGIVPGYENFYQIPIPTRDCDNGCCVPLNTEFRDVIGEIKDACAGVELGQAWNKVKVSASLSEEENMLDCGFGEGEKENIAHLKDGKAVVTCHGQPILLEQPAYITPLIIYLKYGYTQTTKTNIKVLNLRTGRCLEDFPLGSKCNDIEGTLCGQATPSGDIIVPGFNPTPVPTRDCAYGCCVFIGEQQ